MRRQVAAVAAITVIAGLGTGAGAAEAQKPSSNGAHGPTTPAWNTGQTQLLQCPGAERCDATGTHKVSVSSTGVTTGTLSSHEALNRSSLYTGLDWAYRLDDVSLSFSLAAPAHSVTATVHFSGIALGSDFEATSPDGHAITDAGVGAEAVDSACSTRGCGSTNSRVETFVGYHSQLGGVDEPTGGVNTAVSNDIETNSAPTQTVQVTLSMADGSNLPAGTITIFGYTFASTWLSGLGCGGYTQQLCDNGTPHSGAGTATIGATVDSITYTVG